MNGARRRTRASLQQSQVGEAQLMSLGSSWLPDTNWFHSAGDTWDRGPQGRGTGCDGHSPLASLPGAWGRLGWGSPATDTGSEGTQI